MESFLVIYLRAHHFLCAFCFTGSGYTKKFIDNLAAIVGQLNGPDGGNQLITVAPHTDDICRPCPHKRGFACEGENKVRQLDQAHGDTFGLRAGETLSWAAFTLLLKDRLSIEKFDEICQKCEWKASGICESVLRSSGIK